MKKKSTNDVRTLFLGLHTVHALKVNETKLTSGNAFIVDLFPLEGEKESYMRFWRLF